MATLMEIEEAIRSIETKKQLLKQSFDDLQSHSHSFSSFTLSWPQIDSHFSHIQSSLLSRLSLLQPNRPSLPQFDVQNPNFGQKIQSLPELEQTPDAENPKNDQKKETPDDQNPNFGQNIQSLPELEQTPDAENPKNDQKKETPDDQNPEKIQSLPELERTLDDENPKNDRREPSFHNLKQNGEDPDDKNPQRVRLKSICEKMEGEELRKLVKDSLELEKWSVNELSEALKYAPDPYKLVLDATEGNKPRRLSSVMLFESLMMIEGVEFSEEMRDRAKCEAFKWKDEVDKGSKCHFDALGLLSLLGCFKLVNDFDKGYVIELVYIGSKNLRAMNLCRALGLEDRVSEVVQKLISNQREVTALKFIHEFKLVDKFSSMEVLKSYLENAQKKINKRRKFKRNDPVELIDCDVKEKAVLNTFVKHLKDYKLESEYPTETLQQRIKELEESISNGMSKKQQKITGEQQYEVPVSTLPQQHNLQPPIEHIKDDKLGSEHPPETLGQPIEKLDKLSDNSTEKDKKMMNLEQCEAPVNSTGSVSAHPQQCYLQPPIGSVSTRPQQHYLQSPIEYINDHLGSVPTHPQQRYLQPPVDFINGYPGYVSPRPQQHYSRPPIEFVKDYNLVSTYTPETHEEETRKLDLLRGNRMRKKPRILKSLQQYEVPIKDTGSVSTDPQQN